MSSFELIDAVIQELSSNERGSVDDVVGVSCCEGKAPHVPSVPARKEAEGACCKSKGNHDPINPSYYASGKIECIGAEEAALEGLDGFEGFLTGNCLKYLWRWKRKNGLQDLEKAQWYLNRLAERVRKSGSQNTPQKRRATGTCETGSGQGRAASRPETSGY